MNDCAMQKDFYGHASGGNFRRKNFQKLGPLTGEVEENTVI